MNEILKISNYIEGEWQAPFSGEYLKNINPATGEAVASVPHSSQQDCEQAIAAAKTAFPSWRDKAPEERASILLRIAELIEANASNLAKAECDDNGKPLKICLHTDIPRSIANFRFFAHAVTQVASESHHSTNSVNYTTRTALGVVSCISPWNLPLYLFTWKIAPALAFGNTVVAKPSEVTPVTAHLLTQICADAGLPPGVLNVIHGVGSEVGETLVTHPDVAAITFTGGTETGKKIATQAAPHFKKISLELGGKNPNLIFADCDLEKAVQTTVRSAFQNQGQICLCTSRIYAEKPIYEEFKRKLVEATNKLRIMDPIDPKCQQGAMVSKEHYEKVLGHISQAKEAGGRILCGGNPAIVAGRCSTGNFLQPTLLENLTIDSSTNQQEIFGPVATLAPFSTEEEAIALANSSQYGLSATVWTQNLARAHRVANNLDVGMIWINTWLNRDLRTPFGGKKHSGVGREGGLEAYRFFTEPKNVCINFD